MPLKKFPKLKVFLEAYSDEAMVSKLEEYHKAVVRWRVDARKQLKKRLLEIIQQRDEVGTKATMMRFHTLLNNVLESLK